MDSCNRAIGDSLSYACSPKPEAAQRLRGNLANHFLFWVRRRLAIWNNPIYPFKFAMDQLGKSNALGFVSSRLSSDQAFSSTGNSFILVTEGKKTSRLLPHKGKN
jgi:hypothetical protein